MKIGILGSGDVGQALGRGLARHKHQVTLGTRDPAKLAAWQKETGQKVGSFADAAAFGEIVVLALQGAGTEAALELAGPQRFAGKLVLDATNPLDLSSGAPGLFVGTSDSLGERVQRKLPQARVVKCWNTVSNAQMIDPRFEEGVPPMLICGNDSAAKKEAEQLLRSVGWPGVEDAGDISAARWLEALVPLWVRIGAPKDMWGHAFKVVK
ncbi:MAG TPA: NAD(P)-binding domain-containing protein [Candidatus Thermoplasmatota archaeon]|nr:NAD(P)-binding domain-containing protein [Candidatus Thermoplasmatota archaeon]